MVHVFFKIEWAFLCRKNISKLQIFYNFIRSISKLRIYNVLYTCFNFTHSYVMLNNVYLRHESEPNVVTVVIIIFFSSCRNMQPCVYLTLLTCWSMLDLEWNSKYVRYRGRLISFLYFFKRIFFLLSSIFIWFNFSSHKNLI